MSVAKAPVTATVDGKPRKITQTEASVMQMAASAAKGDQRSIASFLKWVDEVEKRASASRPSQFPFEPGDLDVLRQIYERMKLCEPNENFE